MSERGTYHPSLLLGLGRPGGDRGFTLIELLVVMVILGMLAALVAPAYMGRERKARYEAAKTQVSMLGLALDHFRLDVGRYPSTDEGLGALRAEPSGAPGWDGPYLKKEIPLDPWSGEYRYRSPGEHGEYDLWSHGADGTPGGEKYNQDIVSW